MASNMQKGKSLTDGKLTGQIIIDQLLRNVEMGQFEMAYSVLLPCVFSLYLHPEDYTRLLGVMELIKEDARRALSARLAQLNAKPLGFGLTRAGKDRKEYKIACKDWALEFFPDTPIALADRSFQSAAIQNLNLAAMIMDQPSLLKELQYLGHARAPDPKHVGQKLMGE